MKLEIGKDLEVTRLPEHPEWISHYVRGTNGKPVAVYRPFAWGGYHERGPKK